jgi:hypothetical protein
METYSDEERREFDRKKIEEQARFDVDLKAIEATLVDVSDGGLRFDVTGPVRAKLRMKVNGIETIYDARLVWTKNYTDGHTAIGLEFSRPELDRLYGEAHR